MHLDVLYSGLATRIGLLAKRGISDRATGTGPAGLHPSQSTQIAEKPPICRFFDRPAPQDFFGEARSGEQNSFDCRWLEGSCERSRALNPLARRLAISILSRHGEVS
jgi:hypothetical protein